MCDLKVSWWQKFKCKILKLHQPSSDYLGHDGFSYISWCKFCDCKLRRDDLTNQWYESRRGKNEVKT